MSHEKGRTLVIEFHAWRGAYRVGAQFGAVHVIGFVSVCWVPFLLTKWFEDKAKALRDVARKG